MADSLRRPVVRSPKTSEVIARDLAARIAEGGLAPGSRLPVERVMLESLGVGRTTLREALRLLETRGVLTIRAGPKGGPVVRRPSAEDFGDALALILQFEGASLSDVIEARNALEPMLARLAAPRIDAEQAADLQLTVDEILADLEDHDVFTEQNHRFHAGVARAAGSVVLRVLLETLKSIADGTTVGVEYTPRRRRAVAAAHQAVIERLTAGDAEGSAEAMRRHLTEAAHYWRSRYPELYDSPVRWVG